ncbi:ANTAR domain-containing protein [Streptomyces sp. NPDC091972]|uniref:ANTAR domain-containing protein n=1 Tax=Streptomyces sp. NPDC091972 TaxID=3366007 RepID=UPI0038155D05
MRPSPRENPSPTHSTQGADGSEESQQLVDTAAELHREREQLKRAMENRPVIDMARGVLAAGYGCPPQEAWQILVTVSQHTDTALHTVAEAVTRAATGTPLPEHLQEHLAAAVRACEASREPGSSA